MGVAPEWHDRAMAVVVDLGMLEYMRASSGAIQVEVRGCDLQAAMRGLDAAGDEIGRIPHPEQPDRPYPSFVSTVEPGPRGPGFWFDMADAEVYDGLLEGVLHLIVSALERGEVDEAIVTWPEGAAERTMARRDVEALDDAWRRFLSTIEPPDAPEEADPGPSIAPAPGLPTRGWAERAPLPHPRSFLTACPGPDGLIYAIGGARRRPVKTVNAYDLSADRWRRVASLRRPRRGCGAAVGSDGRIYAIGGFGSMESDGLTNVEALDVEANRWQPAAPLVTRVYNEMAAVTGADGRIYAVGSGDRAAPNALETYDVELDRWTPLAPPRAGYGLDLQAVAAPDGRIYLLGGIGIAAEAYDSVRDTWEVVQGERHLRSMIGAALGGDGRIYVMGGMIRGPVDLVETYDPATDKWADADPMPRPRSGMALATGPGGTILAIGGHGREFDEAALDGLIGPTDIYVP